MDPKACWNRICDHLRSGELQEAFDACDELYQWLHKGGFKPDGVPFPSKLAAFAFVLQRVIDAP